MSDIQSSSTPQFDPSDVPMISPEGIASRIPRANLAAATQAGFQHATYMTTPEGAQAVVPTANAGTAMRQYGFQVGRPAAVAAAGEAPSAISSFGRGAALETTSQAGLSESQHPVWDAVKNFLSTTPGEATAAAAVGLPPPLLKMLKGAYSASADQFSQAKQAAQQGNYFPAAVHAVAGAVPIVGPMAERGGEALGNVVTGPNGQFLPPSQWDPEQAGRAVVKAAAPLAMLAGGTPEGAAAADTVKTGLSTAGDVAQALAEHDATPPGPSKPSIAPEAAITNAINPPAKQMPGFQANVAKHIGDIQDYAQRNGLPLNTRQDFLNAVRGAGDERRAYFYQNMLAPIADDQVPAPQGYSGDTTANGATTLGQLDKRLTEINASLSPKYAQGQAAISAQGVADLKNEASAVRSSLYSAMGARLGMSPADVQAVRTSFGKLGDIADKTELALNVERHAANASAARPMKGAINPLSNQFLLGKPINAAVNKFRSTPDSTVAGAFAGDQYPNTPLPPIQGATQSPMPAFLRNMINRVAQNNLPAGQYEAPPTPVAGMLPQSASVGMQSVPTVIQGRPPIPEFLRKALPPQRQIQLPASGGR